MNNHSKKTFQADLQKFLDEGYTLVAWTDDTPKKRHGIFTCRNGHEFATYWQNIRAGRRCTKCTHDLPETTKKVIDDLGYHYTDGMLSCKKCGHKRDFKGRDSLLKAVTCKGCKDAKQLADALEGLNKKLPDGFKIVSYTYSTELMEIKCPSGHHTKLLPIVVRSGKTVCRICRDTVNAPKQRNEKIKGLCKEYGWQLREAYPGNGSFIVNCSAAGHPKEVPSYRMAKVYLSKQCEQCRSKKMVQDADTRLASGLTDTELVDRLGRSMAVLRCKTCGDVFKSVEWGQCPICYGVGSSSGEKELYEFVSSIAEAHHRMKVFGIEIDVFVPGANFGIEYNGLYWHSEPGNANRNRHFDKYEICYNNGIKLLQIWEDEWKSKPDIIKSMIRQAVGLSNKIHARKCKVVQVPPSVCDQFFRANHLEGPGTNGYIMAVGLEYNGELVQVVKLAPHHRTGKGMMLTRMASKLNTTVVGGFTKLLSNLPRPIETWSNNRYSNGDVYGKSGFRLVSILPPDYSYVRQTTRFSKQSLKKTAEERLLPMTEHQLRISQGYRILYDAGKKRWRLD